MTLIRSLNGVLKTHEEMKLYTFKSETLTTMLSVVNERVNPNLSISPDDNQNIPVETL